MEKRAGLNWFGWMVGLLVLAGLGWGAWWFFKKPREQAIEFRTAPVTRGEITQVVTATGQLNPVLNVQVGSQISGMIERLYVDYNASVTQGQIIAELDSATFRAAVLQSEGELANSKAVLELTRIEARRAESLKASLLIPEAEVDRTIASLHQAEAQVMIREANLERARVDLARCKIYAPTNGIVISRNVDVGQTVAASLSAPTLFVIANDLAKMQIDAMVSEADIGTVEAGQSVIFTVDAFPTRTFTGEVMQIRNSPATNQNVVTYDTVVMVENRDLKLKPGMTANVSIVISERENALKLPNAALRFRPVETEPRGSTTSRGAAGGSIEGQSRPGQFQGRGGVAGGARSGIERAPTRTVYVLGTTNSPGSVPSLQPRQVKTGISDGAYTEIIEGLNEGDTVAVGQNQSGPAAQQQRPGAANPFGGGMRRF